MGGSAFSARAPPLATPRMPPEIYNAVLSRTLSLLQKHYTHCASPIEAPGKPDFGDIDILVSSALTPEYNPFLKGQKMLMKPVAEKLQNLLGAEAFITDHNNPTINLAIPWPSQEEKYIQIDIHHLSNQERFEWELFHSAHGDLWNILGSTIRQFGLSANDVGLYLRIPEIEALDRKKSLIFLTSSPSKVLQFLGLDEGRWWKPFASQEEMFRFAAGHRMFFVKKKEAAEGEGVVGAGGDTVVGAQEGGEGGKKALKHNDRQRLAKRPIFRKWIEDFVPKLREEEGSKEASVSREQIKEEAFVMFNVRQEYETRRGEFLLVRHLDEMKRDVIKGSIPPVEEIPEGASFRSAAIKMCRAIIIEGEQFDGEFPDCAKKDEQGMWEFDAVKDWIGKNWRRAGVLGLEKQERGFIESMRLKDEKKRMGAEGKTETESPVKAAKV